MNFGHKIAIAYSFFVVGMISLVIFCVKQDDIVLVSKDYYKKEIAYQDEMDKLHNAQHLSSPVTIERKGKVLAVTFPTEMQGASGEVYFYRPSNAALDTRIPFLLNHTSVHHIDIAALPGGQWVMKMEWKKDNIHYLKEEKVIL